MIESLSSKVVSQTIYAEGYGHGLFPTKKDGGSGKLNRRLFIELIVAVQLDTSIQLGGANVLTDEKPFGAV